MQILFIAELRNGKKEQIFLPIVQGIEPISQPSRDEEFETVTGQVLNLIGGKSLRSFSISSFFPSQIYNFMNPLLWRDPNDFINFFRKYQNSNVPLRIIVEDRFKVILNMLCRIEFSYNLRDEIGDVPYTIDVKEYILPRSGGKNV